MNKSKRERLKYIIDIQDIAYQITLECCRVLVSSEMHGKVVEAIAKAMRDEYEHTSR